MRTRGYFESAGLTLSYLDFGTKAVDGGQGSERCERVMVALHGHFGNASMFAQLADRLEGWRVFALDQRGHGWSDHAPENRYERADYVEDVHRFITTVLGDRPVVLLGHSLGGVNAYQFAAKYPHLVEALIIEDIGFDIDTHAPFVHQLPRRAASYKALKQALEDTGIKGFDYFGESVFEDADGWGFRFDGPGIAVSHEKLNGYWWDDWCATHCPALLIHGAKSWAMDTEQTRRMAAGRPNTELAIFENSNHTIHDDDFEGFFGAVHGFLKDLGAMLWR